jgi:hypothetical protein
MLGSRGGEAVGQPQAASGGFRNNPPSNQAPAPSNADNDFADDDIPF